MRIIQNENIKPFDVDSTLVFTDGSTGPKAQFVNVIDPVTNSHITVRVNLAMIRLLKEEHQRGSHIIVWSRSGWEWAKNVCEALDITKYVHDCMSKPLAYFDDQPVETWLKDRIYIGPDVEYKRGY